MHELIHVKTDEEYQAASILFREYAEWLDIDLGFQNFSRELGQLKIMYGPPAGGLILAKHENSYIGCIAIRNIGIDIAELKRMYVKPTFQQQGLGKKLLKEALVLAQKYGYKKIRLDTLNDMHSAMTLYRKTGFYEIPAYYHNPEERAVYFEKTF